jgi:hypothetical protein
MQCKRHLQVAGKMGSEAAHFFEAPESESEIKRSCQQIKQLYHDPTVVHRLSLQVAIAEERYDDACMYAPHQTAGTCCNLLPCANVLLFIWTWLSSVSCIIDPFSAGSSIQRSLRRLRDKLDKMLATDRMLSLMVAMESALDDARYEVSPVSHIISGHCHTLLLTNDALFLQKMRARLILFPHVHRRQLAFGIS